MSTAASLGDLARITEFTFPMLEVPPAYADDYGSASDLTSTEVPALAAANLHLTGGWVGAVGGGRGRGRGTPPCPNLPPPPIPAAPSPTWAVLRFQPCTMLLPHTHPRGNEFELTIKGTVRSFFVSDQDGALREAVSPFGTLQIYPQVHSSSSCRCVGSLRCALRAVLAEPMPPHAPPNRARCTFSRTRGARRPSCLFGWTMRVSAAVPRCRRARAAHGWRRQNLALLLPSAPATRRPRLSVPALLAVPLPSVIHGCNVGPGVAGELEPNSSHVPGKAAAAAGARRVARRP